MIDINNFDAFSIPFINIYNSKTQVTLGKIEILPSGYTFIAASTLQSYTQQDLESIINVLKSFNSIKKTTESTDISVNVYSHAITLLEQRDKLRSDKQFNEADTIKKQIEELGFIVIDTPKGSKLEQR